MPGFTFNLDDGTPLRPASGKARHRNKVIDEPADSEPTSSHGGQGAASKHLKNGGLPMAACNAGSIFTDPDADACTASDTLPQLIVTELPYDESLDGDAPAAAADAANGALLAAAAAHSSDSSGEQSSPCASEEEAGSPLFHSSEGPPAC